MSFPEETEHTWHQQIKKRRMRSLQGKRATWRKQKVARRVSKRKENDLRSEIIQRQRKRRYNKAERTRKNDTVSIFK